MTRIGFETTDWVRVVMYERCFEFIQTLNPENLAVLEIAAGPRWNRQFKFHSFTETQYPEFDICVDTLDKRFDLIIADQVFEHLAWPYRAARNIFSMLNPGGYLIISTPFLVRVHEVPIDCTRWTETGLSYLLQEAGFPANQISTGSWGNLACVRANLKKWPKRGFFRSLTNEPAFPVMVWAFARKPLNPTL